MAIHYFSSSDTANQLVEYAKSKGQIAISVSGDLTREKDANVLVEKTVEELKKALEIHKRYNPELYARNDAK